MAKILREPARTVPVIGHYDVVVLGGGPAGVAAAVSAARGRARVLLVEQTGCLGGMSTNGRVPVFAPLGNGPRPAVTGITLEVVERLRSVDGVGKNTDTLAWIPIDAEKLKLVYDQLTAEAGVEVLYFTLFADVRRRGRRVTHVILENKAGRQAVASKMFIDATGDADVAARAGAGFDKGDDHGRMQPAGLCYTVAGIDLPTWRRFLQSIGPDRAGWWKKLEDSGALPKLPKTEYRGLEPFELAPGVGVVNFAHLFDVDGCNPKDLSRAMRDGRAMAHAFIECARRNLPGMKNARIVATAALPGIRETRRIRGRRRLTIEDFLSARHSDDDIACYDYPVDVHNVDRDARKIKRFQKDFERLRLPVGKTYGIPFGCLLPKGLDNLAVAGRSLSADRSMHGSARVMPACFAMGQAAGLAAALAAKRKMPLHKLDVADLRRRLTKAGVRLA